MTTPKSRNVRTRLSGKRKALLELAAKNRCAYEAELCRLYLVQGLKRAYPSEFSNERLEIISVKVEKVRLQFAVPEKIKSLLKRSAVDNNETEYAMAHYFINEGLRSEFPEHFPKIKKAS